MEISEMKEFSKSSCACDAMCIYLHRAEKKKKCCPIKLERSASEPPRTCAVFFFFF